MNAFEFSRRHLQRLGCDRFGLLAETIATAYGGTPVSSGLEFSLRLDRPSVRFGVFGVPSVEKLRDLFRLHGYGTSVLDAVAMELQEATHTYGFGVDWEEPERVKAYFLRLPDSPRFRTRPGRFVASVAKAAALRIDVVDVRRCCLLGLDMFRDGRCHVKVYLRDARFDPSAVGEGAVHVGLGSRAISTLQRWPKAEDVTYAYRFGAQGCLGGAVFLATGSCEPLAHWDAVARRALETFAIQRLVVTHAGFAHVGRDVPCVYFSAGVLA